MKNACISVIIPVYNVVEYLPKCLDSVLVQTYKDFEIIAVDDGSTDGSAEVLKAYAQKDSRVKPIFKANGGVSSARNAGLDAAAGDYIFFLDGDDRIAPYTLEKLYAAAAGFDIVQGAYVHEYSNGKQLPPTDTFFIEKEVCDRCEMLSLYFTARIHESSCNKLYRKSAIGDMRFDETMAVAEDSHFVYRLLQKISKIKLLTDVIYYYFIRKDSCMHEGIAKKHFAIMDLRDMQYRNAQGNAALFNTFIFRYAKDIFFLLHGILRDRKKTYYDRIPELRKKFLKEKKRIFLSRDLGLRFKVGALLLWWFPGLFYKIYSKL